MTDTTDLRVDDDPERESESKGHPEPLGEKDHWVRKGGIWHASGTGGNSACGERGGDVSHYKSINGLNQEDMNICDECREVIER